MKYFVISLLLLFAVSCREHVSDNPTNNNYKKTYLHAYDYAQNVFFLDTAYQSVFKDYFKYSTPIIPQSAFAVSIKEIEVWESTTEITNNAYGSQACCITDLSGIKSGEFYDPKLKLSPINQGVVERGTFTKLDSSQFIIDYNLGVIKILNMRIDRYYAVAYRIEGQTQNDSDDIYYGNLSRTVKQTDTLLLKLIYRPNLVPAFTSLWNRQMKNFYSFDINSVNFDSIKIKIYYINNNKDTLEYFPNIQDNIMTILGVDLVSLYYS